MDASPRLHTNVAYKVPLSLQTACPYFFSFLACCWARTRLTILASSTRNARTMRSRTQLAQREPPYARWTVFCLFEICAYWRGRRAGTPGRAMWQSPHFGADAAFLTVR